MSLKAAVKHADLPEEPPPLFTVVDEKEPETSIRILVALVINAERPYEEVAEQIEDKAYELCDGGKIAVAVEVLSQLTSFFELIREKNDEQCRDLADVYLLVGQIHQFAGLFEESIQWFSKSAIVDDRYASPFHNMAVSYTHLKQFDSAIRCYEQELTLALGNYYTYLLLADLYKRENRTDDVEHCLQRLLERDPANIQGLHSLIRHYEERDQSIDTALLVRRLVGVNRKLSRVEVIIKSYYLCRSGRLAEVLDNIDVWTGSADAVTITDLIKAHVCNELRQYKKCRQILQSFKERNHGRVDIMTAKLQEFKTLFGEDAANALSKILLLPSSKT